QWIGMFEEPAANGMSRLVISDDAFLIGRDDLVLLLQTSDDPVHRILKVFHLDRLFSLTGCDERGLVADIGDIRSGETGCLFGQFMDVQLAGYFNWLEMYLENRLPALQIGFVDGDLTVEPARTQ